jgi:hypothetical protein
MGRIFQKDFDYPVDNNKKFSSVVDEAKSHAANITWQELAQFNWATSDPREVNRALVETIGCRKIDEKDPSNTEFEPLNRSPQNPSPQIAVPKLLTKPIEPGKTYTIKLKKRKPAPAVAITGLTRWFVPQTGKFEVKYSLEGIKERADKVDFEVHTQNYYEDLLDEKGNKTGDTKSLGNQLLLQRRAIYSVADTRAPSAEESFGGWKGESEADKGVLAKPAYINYGCAPYTVLLRYYKNDADKDTRILPGCFCPLWKAPAKPGDPWQLEKDSLKGKWELTGNKDKLKAGQLIVWDKDDKEVLRVGLGESVIQKGEVDLSGIWKEADVKRESMPYRLQLQAHSGQDQDDGLALAAMHSEVNACQYDKVQFIAFNIKPGTTENPVTKKKEYLGESDDALDIESRCQIMVDAIQNAQKNGNVETSEKVLKLFMAPEFYFRGKGGSYKVEQIPKITQRMLQETGKFEYVDWLFVYGTAIGEIAHEDKPGVNKRYGGPGFVLQHNCRIDDIAPDPEPWVKVTSKAGDRMDASLKTGVTWKVKQGAEVEEVAAFDKNAGKITLKTRNALKLVKSAVLLEPDAHNCQIEDIGPDPETWIKVTSKAADYLDTSLKTGVAWKVKQDAKIGEVTAFDKTTGKITLTSRTTLKKGPAFLLEPEVVGCNIEDIAPEPWIKVVSKAADRMDASFKSGVIWKVKQDAGSEEVAAFDKNTGHVTLKTWKALKRGPAFLLEPEVWILSTSDVPPDTKLTLWTSYGSRILDKPKPWNVIQDGTTAEVISKPTQSGDNWEVTVKGKPSFKPGLAQLEEPLGSEIVNTALVQKGWPAHCPCKRQLKQAVIFKERISHLDFIGPHGFDDKKWEDLPTRLIEIDNIDRVPLPPEGSTDTLGRNPNPQGQSSTWKDKEGQEHTVGSEVNLSGQGGGSVITVDGITFGIEVCLDHGKGRLRDYYNANAQKGEPLLQVHLIPSWGMTIYNPKTVDKGLIFNVDGSRGDSEVRWYDGATYCCPTHRDQNSANPGTCDRYDTFCSTCNDLQTYSGACKKCWAPRKDIFQCKSCGGWRLVLPSGHCGNCGNPAPPCGQTFALVGAKVSSSSTQPLPKSSSPSHFVDQGSLEIFPAQPLPGPESVS